MLQTMKKPSFLKRENQRIAYHHSDGKSPGIVFLPGFRSDMEGTKALHLDKFCAEKNIQYTRFDYSGHGISTGSFNDLTLSHWLDDTLAILDEITTGPQILVGSSMGGWLMMLAALKRPDRVKGLVGIAPAPDFTEDMLNGRLLKDQLDEIMTKGFIDLPSCYDDMVFTITKKLLEDGKNHLLYNRNSIDIHCPFYILQGMLDEDVPYERVQTLLEKVSSPHMLLHLIKDGDHRLSRAQDLSLLQATVQEMLDFLEASE
jgi:pimeloyl-ACP methyl ester carboxylesterase